ncbi:hypothetical protein FS749_007352 [Ceratobasidium sp. UAMH 11750]|nr:hypothetical protein FS749_007352 [Ceratobasidium sp. UAMH 11750]
MASKPTAPSLGLLHLNEKASSGSLGIDQVHVFDKEGGSEVARDLGIDSEQLDRLARLAEQITDEEAEILIREVLEDHEYDPLYPNSVLDVAKRFLRDPDLRNDPALYQKTLREVKLEVALIIHDSPYAEVRAVVSPEDDPSMPCSTVRAWTIGLLFACAGAIINQFFSLRFPRIDIDEVVTQLLAYRQSYL